MATGVDSKSKRTDAATAEPAGLREAAELRRSITRLARRLRADRTGAQVTLAKLSVLGHLQAGGPLAAGELAERERAQPQSLTRVLAEMEQDGLIQRAADPDDRRRSIVRITPAGSGVLQREMRGRDVWLASAMAATLTPTERQLLALVSGLLDRLADA